eukprot:TRINITY_DN849_c0_g1_i1.p1 TRINITY_DN849_c0_g1~~TRINITY_DN849_c0_g1_i1.p1  ORF type:complete len:258 (-),score=76.85 TRINITY_DN849_c0_g1_i1:78-851(-)
MSAKFDVAKANEAKEWIESMTGEQFSSDDFGDSLKSGVLLCKLLNKIEPGTVPKINTQNMAFKQMENIAAYLEGSRKLGVPDQYNFMTVDLFEKKNLGQVALSVLTLKKEKGFGFEKSGNTPSSGNGQGIPSFSIRDQSTQPKSQEEFVQREPTNFTSSNDVARAGQAKTTGRLANDEAFKCPVCTKFVTSGAVNALGKAWHPNCFTCKKCGVKLSNTKYYEHDENAYCERCILMVKPQNAVKTASGNLAERKGFKF